MLPESILPLIKCPREMITQSISGIGFAFKIKEAIATFEIIWNCIPKNATSEHN